MRIKIFYKDGLKRTQDLEDVMMIRESREKIYFGEGLSEVSEYKNRVEMIDVRIEE